MKFCLYFARFCMCKFVCVSELFYFIKVILIGTKKLTKTFKLTHRNEKNTRETSCLDGEEFNTQNALSLYNFHLCLKQLSFRTANINNIDRIHSIE
jgi:hypothetical protein